MTRVVLDNRRDQTVVIWERTAYDSNPVQVAELPPSSSHTVRRMTLDAPILVRVDAVDSGQTILERYISKEELKSSTEIRITIR